MEVEVKEGFLCTPYANVELSNLSAVYCDEEIESGCYLKIVLTDGSEIQASDFMHRPSVGEMVQAIKEAWLNARPQN